MTRAVLLRGPGLLEIADVEGATMGAHDVTLDVAAVGLCGTDFHIYAGEGNYNLDAQGGSSFCDGLFDIGQAQLSVNVRLTLPEQVQVGSV